MTGHRPLRLISAWYKGSDIRQFVDHAERPASDGANWVTNWIWLLPAVSAYLKRIDAVVVYAKLAQLSTGNTVF